MIRITDMTLTCIAALCPSAEQTRRLFELLMESGADAIEVPATLYETLRPISPERLVIHIDNPAQADDYPDVKRFVCRKSGLTPSGNTMIEHQVNDVRELNFLGQDGDKQPVRLVGLDDLLVRDYEAAFRQIKKRLRGRVELCPENSYDCATAIAFEWLATRGDAVASSFGGIGGKAATEELLLALRVARRHRPTASFAVLPEIAAVVEEITGTRFSDRKAVIGRGIFSVESGIHIDGIIKKPQMYEPYMPELVGRSRLFVVGKHSGRKSVAAKLTELGLPAAEYDVSRILGAVRDESIAKKSSLTDDEFYAIAQQHPTNRGGAS